MILRAQKQHLKALFLLENALFAKSDFPLSRGSFYYHIKNNELYVYMKNDTVIAYILWLKRKNYYRLYSLGVSKEHRGTGVAQELLSYTFENLPTDSYSLEVKTTNENAVKLYKKNGFRVKKTLTGYYPGGYDGYLMFRTKRHEA